MSFVIIGIVLLVIGAFLVVGEHSETLTDSDAIPKNGATHIYYVIGLYEDDSLVAKATPTQSYDGLALFIFTKAAYDAGGDPLASAFGDFGETVKVELTCTSTGQYVIAVSTTYDESEAWPAVYGFINGVPYNIEVGVKRASLLGFQYWSTTLIAMVGAGVLLAIVGLILTIYGLIKKVPPPPPPVPPQVPPAPPAVPTPPAVPQICPTCGTQCTWIPQYSRWYCPNCRQYR